MPNSLKLAAIAGVGLVRAEVGEAESFGGAWAHPRRTEVAIVTASQLRVI
jgi:hypothetical protein